MSKPILFDQVAINDYAKKNKIQPFRVKQIFYEIFKNQNIKLDEITTLSKDLRSDLEKHFDILSLEINEILEDSQTTKIWFKTHDGHIIEAVIIYHRSKYPKPLTKDYWLLTNLNRITLCISSQIGCPLNCLFCVTGKMWIKRNLTRDEIISQILVANNIVKNKFWKKEDWTLRAVRNVVFMWMWEPLLNYDEVKKSIEIMLAQDRLSLSRRHVTISTAGIIDGIKKLIKDKIEVKLAISLHCADQEIREKLMPIAKTQKLNDLMKVIDEYVKATDNRIFYEYIMIKDITDKPELANKLANLLKNRLAHVNLIAYNKNPMINLQESSIKTIREFQDILEKKWITVTIRDSMWRSVKSSCWQLGYEAVVRK